MRAGKKESIGVLIGAMAEAESKSFYDDTEAVTSDLKSLLNIFLKKDSSSERVQILKDYESGAPLTGKGGIRQRLGAIDMEFFGRAYFPHYFSRPCSIKERKFKKGLQRRIELITNILNIMGHNYDYRDIVPKFRRNRPQNDMETAQIVTMLANDLSRETRLQLMPGVENVQDELRKLEEEKNKEQEDFGVYKNFTKAFQGAADRTEAVTDEPEGT